ncbi:MAG TPA: SIS domain-containing protein [Aquihabitans sp.]|nr:SIS domain-containing protein [Aquihabitans sp.]
MPDSLGLRDALLDLPEQMAAASRSLSVTGPLPGHDEVANVLVVGTGAAGWVGDLLAAVAGPFMPVPLVVHKGFEPPSFVDASTLVVAISASGDSPEAVSAATTCVEAGGRLFAVTSGGQLGALADAHEAPTVFLPAASTPVPTRARIGALAVPVLKAFDALGFFPGSREWIAAAIAQLRVRRDELATDDNLATTVARTLAGTMPIVYGGGTLGGVAAARWKVQLNQSAKTPAWTGELPDVVHGEIAGWGQHGDVTRQVLSLVLLRHDDEAPEVAEQFTTVESWTDEVMASIVSISAAGEGRLAQLLDLALVGDVVALHLAAQYGIDPGPTPAIAASPAAAPPEAVPPAFAEPT